MYTLQWNHCTTNGWVKIKIVLRNAMTTATVEKWQPNGKQEQIITSNVILCAKRGNSQK
jgi:hypothetical protein